MNKRVVEALVRAGALDSLGARRSQLEAAIDAALEYGQKRRADREAGQGSLFGGGDEAADVRKPPLPDVPEWDDKTRLQHEKSTLGFYVSGHPLDDHRDLLERFASHSSQELRKAANKTQVVLGGVITDLQRRKSRKGDMWASFTLEDLEGQVDVLVFPKTYRTCEDELAADRPAMVEGRLEVEEDRVRVIADAVSPLEQLREKRVEAVQVRLDAADLDDALVARLRKTIDAHPGDTALLFEVARPGSYRMLARAESSVRVSPTRRFTEELEEVLGPHRLRLRTRRA